MIREIDLVSYLPPFLADFKEIVVALEAENPEFGLVWKAANQVLQNEFIELADEYGVARWEKILNLYPEKSDSLDVRKLQILTKLNIRLPFTMKMLHKRLQDIIGSCAYQIRFIPENYFLEVIVTGQSLKELQVIRQMVEEMIPLNLLFLFTGREVLAFYIKIGLENAITFQSDFYPRYNIPSLCLDGTWFLDGTYTLDGYADHRIYDFYPVQLIFHGGFLQNHKIGSIFQAKGRIGFPISFESKEFKLLGTASTKLEQNETVEISGNVKQEFKKESSLMVAGEIFSQVDSESKEIELVGDVSVALEQKAEMELVGCAKQNVEMAGCLEVEKDLWFLDGTYALDGEKLLDAEVFYYEE